MSADERALLDRLVVDLTPRLMAYATCFVGPNDAEDVVAEAFCRAAVSVQALKASARPELYLLTVTRNLCRDRHRRRKTAATLRRRQANIIATTPDPQVIATRCEQLDALRAAVAQLPTALREVVVLRLSTGLTFEEAATVLQIPLGTALSRMHAALRQIRQRLGPAHELCSILSLLPAVPPDADSTGV